MSAEAKSPMGLSLYAVTQFVACAQVQRSAVWWQIKLEIISASVC
jgi:hypothetical protein